jgi:hypothetical protein
MDLNHTESLVPQLCILFVGQVECDLSRFLSNHHGENVAVLERLGPAGAACEFDQSFVRGEAGSASQRRTHTVGEEDQVLGILVSEKHYHTAPPRLADESKMFSLRYQAIR